MADSARGWRDESVLVYFHHGRWKVHPAVKVVSPGQEVTWVAIDCKRLDLLLPDVFDDRHPSSTDGSVRTRVKANARRGVFDYAAICDGQAAEGGSSPELIVDP